jgi:hypothetical protein
MNNPGIMKTMSPHVLPIALLALLSCGWAQAADTVVYEGKVGPGYGKQIVLISGDEEYRSEEGLPMLAKILAVRHGFKCTVLFAINPVDHTIDPVTLTNISGMETLRTADLCVIGLRFRELPDEQMKYFVDYLEAGKPIIALRTSTHAFAYERNKQSPYARFDWRSKDWPGGFGQQVLGETWVSHHGAHGTQSTRAIINDRYREHPILRGVSDIWGPTDVYTVTHLKPEDQVLVRGEVLTGMHAGDPPVEGAKNSPMMPLVWLRQYSGGAGKTSKIMTTTMGAAVDLKNEGLRRLLVNACYWAAGVEKAIPARADVAYVGTYEPTWFGFGGFKKGVKPSNLELR